MTIDTPSGAPRPFVSYHAMHDALTLGEPDDAALFAHALRRVVDGLVSHAAYAGAAQAADGRLAPTVAARRLDRLLAHDVNPLAALFPPRAASACLAARWNALNRRARFGVSTEVRAGDAAQLNARRTPPAGEADHALRIVLGEHCVDWLATRDDDAAASGGALLALAERLTTDRGALRDTLALLYAEPSHELVASAARLGVSPRTLQRHLAQAEAPYARLRQAVRITLAGQRLRERDESLTDTAQAAGFFDAAHMVHAWQRACGLPPSAYRTIARLAR
jgi:AraC-like DNA-binding protein